MKVQINKLNYSKIFALSVFTSIVQKTSQFIYGFFSLPIILAAFTKYDYGVWIILCQIIALAFFLDLGIANSFPRFLSHYLKKNSQKAINLLFSTTIYFLCFMSIILAILLILNSNLILRIYGVDDKAQYVTAFVFSILLSMATLPLRLLVGVYLSTHKLYLYDLIIAATAIIKLYCIYLLSQETNMSLNWLVFVVFGMDFLSYLALYAVSRKFIKFSLKVEYFSKKILKEIFSFSIFNIAFSIILFLMMQFPVFLISKLISIKEIIFFSIPITILVNFGAIFGRVGTIFTPISVEFANKNQVNFSRMLSTYTNLILIASFVFFVCTIFFGEIFLHFWLQHDNKVDIHVIASNLSVISFPYLSSVAFLSYKNTLFSNGHHKYLVVLYSMIFLLTVIAVFCFSHTTTSIIYLFSIMLVILCITNIIQIGKYFKYSFFTTIKKEILFTFLALLYFLTISLYVH